MTLSVAAPGDTNPSDATAVIARAIMSVRLYVCLSVCQSYSGVWSRRMKIRSCSFLHQVGKSS